MSVVDGLRELHASGRIRRHGLSLDEGNFLDDALPLLLDVVEAVEELLQTDYVPCPVCGWITSAPEVTHASDCSLAALESAQGLSAKGGAKRPPCPRGVLEHALYPCSCKPNEDYGKLAQGAEQRPETDIPKPPMQTQTSADDYGGRAPGMDGYDPPDFGADSPETGAGA